MSTTITKTPYISKPVDSKGNVKWTKEEDKTWEILIERQLPIIKNRACKEYLEGLELLNLPTDRAPQCHEVSQALLKTTGWSLEPVPALIPIEDFFQLLANKKFPAATFIRRREDLDYIEEPDIFHEVFGHCPLLTNPAIANFAHNYGKMSLRATAKQREMLERLYWFTVEFGLIKTPLGNRIYGGGILSSPGETPYSIDSKIPQRKPFDVVDVLRTPYRIDIMQPIYFVIDDFQVLFDLVNMDLMSLIAEAQKLGMHKPVY